MYGLSKDGLNKWFSSQTTEYSLTGLDEFTTYYVQVHAETSVTGPSSDIITARTNEDAPSSAPIIDRKETKAEDAHTIRVKWNEIVKVDQNGFILGYEVLYREKGQQNSFRLNTTTTDTIIRGLKPYTEYCIQLQGFTKAGKSQFSPCVYVETLEKGPSQPVNVQVQAVSSVAILVKWDAPAHPNGEIKEYIIFYGTSEDVQKNERKVTGSTRKRTIDGLNKYTTYYVKVRGSASKPGNASEIFSVTTLEDSPGPPKEFRAQVVTANDVHLTWQKPDNSNGIVRFYYIKIYNTKTGLQFGNPINQSADERSHVQHYNRVIPDLKYYTDYTFTIQAVTVKPGEMANATARTEEGVPSQPQDVSAKLDKGGTSITVSWKDPKDHNGIITMYTVYFAGKRGYDPSFTDNHEIVLRNSSRSTEIGVEKLKPGTEYSIYVKARTVKGYGAESDRVERKTPSKRPPRPKPPQVVEVDVTTTTITISLSPSSDHNGEIIRHEIIVEMLGTARARRETTALPKNIYGYEEAQTYGDRFYIAAMFEKRKLPAEFVLGNGKTYGDYKNVPLKPGTRYNVYVRGVTERDGKWLYGEPAAISQLETEESPVVKEGDNMVGVVAGVLGALILIVIAIIAFLLYQRSSRPPNANLDVESQKKQKRKRKEFELRRSSLKKKLLAAPGEVVNDADHPPITVDQFAKHVAKLHKSDDRGYMIEYNKLDSGQEYPCDAGLMPENKAKNRYGNIIAYDHSRVVLSPIEGESGSDYINATRIDGYNKPNAYIACQGPVPPTFDDFWRMVWEQQSSTIVMLTNLQERHKLKCHKYWPDETQDYGDISVMLVRSEHYSDYNIRTFNVKRESEKEEREVKQFHFTVWPDHGVPEYPTALLAFRRRVRAYNPADAGPPIVHCSAGVGRTGTFMVIDSTLDRIKAESTIDIFNFVAYLRSRRPAMVQTEEQYTFCHDAILEALQCGNTQIYAHDLRITLARMNDVDPETKMTRFESEFKRLNKVSPVLHKGHCIVASYPENKEKNRSAEILAPDCYRVVLTAIDDNESTSYINAVHISGYKQQHAFIVTQHPLTSTVTDFWRMLCEQESSCVVLFDSREQEGDFPEFWQDSETDAKTYDDMLTVQRLAANSSSVDNLKATYDQTEITEKTFKATDLRTPEKSLRIKMFQYSGWVNENEEPPASGLITLIAKVEKWQQHSGNGPITVVCSDGLGRSGTFCALYSVLERLKIEQVVDVFQAIKAMRIPRPGLVKTAGEYKFVHYAIQDYLSAFDDYANFKP
ncbi:receptor-type tyrosine-protein phosphatase epsilon-like isoform X2 [Stylophora pistillata]|uniref:receptor-type tyrosine-protein phosphatase epsilon-like isoform X2 n=1 Tax=Stylophora pistillata TaxID=50429 RepID=UPI000C045A67|nr:receptor-type tyrosine-protein phosphatase epsilon-like isoform X2 [Stylophora pistillata]